MAKVKPTFHRHEVLHLTSVVQDLVYNHLSNSTYILSGINPKAQELLDKIENDLGELYQTIGEHHEVKKKIKVDKF